MKHLMVLVVVIVLTVCDLVFAQSVKVKDDFKPSSTNQSGRIFPQVNSEGCVRAQITAPDATYVQLDLGGVKYNMVKDDNGVWTGESAPQDEGFHYYQLNIDGASVPDPGTKYYYGAGRWGSGIEIPAKDQDFYAVKDVAHGVVCENIYFSKITNSFRRCFVYMPAGYEVNTQVRYPVLYLQHGSFEDETGWPNQGKANLILDNLIASGSAVPMIVVMDNGYAYQPQGANDSNNRPVSVFENVVVDEIVPMIDAKFRTKADRDHRAIAGLSMGANQTMRIFMNHLDKFSHYGGFSGTSNYPSADEIDPLTFMDGKFSDAKLLNDKVKVFWLGLGTKEPQPFPGSVGAFRKMLDKKEIKYVYYESTGTAHEWLTWRRSLYQFAQLLFKQ